MSDNFSVSIAIATSNGYDVYKLSELSQNNRRTLEEIGDPRNQCSGYLQILDRQHIGLDKSGNKELILKFLKNTYCCPTCAIPLNYRSYEGYVIFDFDKLIMLELTTRSSMFVTSDGVPASERVAKFEKNYLRVGKRKYYYRNGALVRK
ncbi:hypothetical protein [Flavobacterium sp.]|uniref:hypothetical protein n=1 Tax=Flavobacterium sp. TaxID=239 RepID=UPI00120FB88D|nr:hypothetical protein [Flavobacterium sp.]RZJ71456.1 MAG: hypothetical protein EOO49_10375 [Flavobacterium sp.]